MALVKTVRGKTPQFGGHCYLAENATIIGDVVMGDHCSLWFNTVIRGDVNSIRIGNRVNIQDGAVLHCSYESSVIEIGDHVSVGHNVIIHGAQISGYVLIGMGAILMDHVAIGENAIIAAGALLLKDTVVEPNSVYGGVPAKKIKTVDPGQTREMIHQTAERYLMYARWYQADDT